MPNPPVVIGLGELLWDVFPGSRRPGGAPANVAFQAAQLGCDGQVASRVGEDSLGREIVAFLQSKGLQTSLIQFDSARPTGRVTVDVSQQGQPDYTIHENVGWDDLQPVDELLETAANASAVCFGTLAQRSSVSRETIHRVLAACRDECLVVYDVNLRQQWYQRDWIERSLRAATVAKLNREEADVLDALLNVNTADHAALARRLIEDYGLSLVCITRAEDGSLLVTKTDSVDHSGEPVEVVDAVGAGDAFTAALIFARLNDWPLDATARFANDVGGLVASRAGAMPELRSDLAALQKTHAP